MIITTELHGRRRRDGRALIRHLAKTENEYAYIAAIGNCVAATLLELIAIMEVYRDASAARPAFHHATVNPAHDLSPQRLIEAAHRVRIELDPENSRPYGIVLHGKRRAEPGGAPEHAHLLVAHVDSQGRALKTSWSKLRTERIARELEFVLGEPPVLGRHHRTVLKALRVQAPEVARWLEAALGADPPKPRAAFAPGARGRARKEGIDLPRAKAAVRAAWRDCKDETEFRDRLVEHGLQLMPGNTPGVWVIQDRNGHLVGAADRLLRLTREDFQRLMDREIEPTAEDMPPIPTW
jgi:hypothetical protein